MATLFLPESLVKRWGLLAFPFVKRSSTGKCQVILPDLKEAGIRLQGSNVLSIKLTSCS